MYELLLLFFPFSLYTDIALAPQMNDQSESGQQTQDDGVQSILTKQNEAYECLKPLNI